MTRSTPILQISGEAGGGQLLRSSLSLSLVTGQPFRMTNIRGKRPKPGLMRQHLTCVKAAAEICGGVVDGAELGSTELVFRPEKIVGGDNSFAIGSGGGTTLVLQTLLPALLHAEAASTLRIEGGTHNPMAPPFEFIGQCYLPALASMGVKASVALERAGFMQAGGGVLRAAVQPMKKWKKLKLTERGEAGETFGRVLHAHLHRDIAEREISTAAQILGWPEERIELRYANDSPGPGNALMLGARFSMCARSAPASRRWASRPKMWQRVRPRVCAPIWPPPPRWVCIWRTSFCCPWPWRAAVCFTRWPSATTPARTSRSSSSFYQRGVSTWRSWMAA